MKYLLCAGGIFLLSGCSPFFSSNMTWKDYYLSRDAIRVTTNRAEIIGCEELGAVSGSSHENASAAKEEAISSAVVLGADHLLFDEVKTDVTERSTYLSEFGQVFNVYGIAYKCGK